MTPAKVGRTALGVVLIFPTPFLLFATLLHLTRRQFDFGGWELPNVVIGTAVAVVGVALLPFARRTRVWIALAVAPLAAVALLVFALTYVCGAFGDCI